MGSEIDWGALGVLSEYFRVEDAEALIDSLIQIKDYCDKVQAAKK